MPKLGLITLCLLSACTLAPDYPVEVLAPPLPAAWPAAGAYELSWVDNRGRTGGLDLPVGASCWLWLPRGGEALVELTLAVPSADGSTWRSQPLGALYPADLAADGRLRPDVAGGWCSRLALPLLRSGWRLANFNWRRLRQELQDRLPDPWVLEPSLFSAVLASGRWRADYLRPPSALFTILLPVWLNGLAGGEAGDRAYPASPGAQPWSLEAAAVSGLLLPAGSWHSFWSQPAGRGSR